MTAHGSTSDDANWLQFLTSRQSAGGAKKEGRIAKAYLLSRRPIITTKQCHS
jgi:hypothetical protein